MNKLQNNLNSNKFGFCNKICYYYNGFVEKKWMKDKRKI